MAFAFTGVLCTSRAAVAESNGCWPSKLASVPMDLQHNASLQAFNTFGIAAAADRLGRFSSGDELRALLATPEVKNGPLLILGGGSNILFTQDFHGTVLLNEVPGFAVVEEDEDHVWVKAGAGMFQLSVNSRLGSQLKGLIRDQARKEGD